MSVESVIYSRLTTHSGLSALVSNRVYPKRAPQKPTLPAITFFRVSTTRFSASGSDISVVKARFQFDVLAATYDSEKAVVAQLIDALQRWRHSATGQTTVQATYLENESEWPYNDAETEGTSIDALICYEE